MNNKKRIYFLYFTLLFKFYSTVIATYSLNHRLYKQEVKQISRMLLNNYKFIVALVVNDAQLTFSPWIRSLNHSGILFPPTLQEENDRKAATFRACTNEYVELSVLKQKPYRRRNFLPAQRDSTNIFSPNNIYDFYLTLLSLFF